MAKGRNTKLARATRDAQLFATYRSRRDEELVAILDGAQHRLLQIRTATAEAKKISLQINTVRHVLRDAEVQLNRARESGWGYLKLRREPAAHIREAEAEAEVTEVRQKLAALHSQSAAAEQMAKDRYFGEKYELRSVVAAVREIRQARRREVERARLNALDGKARSGVRKHRTIDFQPDVCPYCCGKLTETHYDHIMPVARGGLSEPSNLVFICKPCNQAKKALTLLQFCRKRGFDFAEIVARLESLGKVV